MSVVVATVVGVVVGLAISVLVLRAGLAPLRREVARVADELQLRNEAEYGGADHPVGTRS